MKKYIIIFSFFGFTSLGFSQNVEDKKISENIKSSLEGTYQVILSDKRMIEPEITKGILYLINDKRMENDVVYITIDEYTKIQVLPFSVIKIKEFTPLKKYRYEE